VTRLIENEGRGGNTGHKESFISRFCGGDLACRRPPNPSSDSIGEIVERRPPMWPRGNDSGRLTFIDPGKTPDTLPKLEQIQGFRSGAAAINVIFRT
jgi:hypothetical protein